MTPYKHYSLVKLVLFIAILPVFFSCEKNHVVSDAFGNFETTPVFISPDVSGKIIWLSMEEGESIDSGQLVAIIDTTSFYLSLQELESQQRVVRSRIHTVEAQAETLDEQLKSLMIELHRARRLYQDGAITEQALDDLEGRKNVLNSQIRALDVQRGSILSEWDVLEQKKLQVLDKRSRCFIRNPFAGTVLEKYMEQFEIAVAGKPIYKLADLRTLELKIYVDALKLKQVAIGDTVIVRIDEDEKSNIEIPGVVSWISSQAEFTPKIIQTKEERVHLVYAVKILVQNDGQLKIGLPGEVVFQLPKKK